jgi:hypothetical protein
MAVNLRKTLPFTATFAIETCLFVAAMCSVRNAFRAGGSIRCTARSEPRRVAAPTARQARWLARRRRRAWYYRPLRAFDAATSPVHEASFCR